MADPDWKTSAAEIEAIVAGRHGDPFAVLGLHQAGKRWVARAFVPGAAGARGADARRARASAQLRTPPRCRVLRRPGDARGAPAARLSRRATAAANGRWRMPICWARCWGRSTTTTSARATISASMTSWARIRCGMRAHDGVHFAVWAPNASRVSVVGDFNGWDGRRHVMRKRLDTGVWEIFIPGAARRPVLQIRAARRRRASCCR